MAHDVEIAHRLHDAQNAVILSISTKLLAYIPECELESAGRHDQKT